MDRVYRTFRGVQLYVGSKQVVMNMTQGNIKISPTITYVVTDYTSTDTGSYFRSSFHEYVKYSMAYSIVTFLFYKLWKITSSSRETNRENGP